MIIPIKKCVILLTCVLAANCILPTGAEPASVATTNAPGKWQKFWMDRVKTFADENAKLDPKSRNIVFLGDSLTQGFKLKEFFPNLPVLNRGIVSDGVCDFPNGHNVWRGVTRRMKECVFDTRPSYLIFLIGTNDVGVKGVPLDYWMTAYKDVINQTRKKFPDVKIILVTLPPSGLAYARHETLNSRILEWNTMIRKYAAEEKFRLVDLHKLLAGKDGLLPANNTKDGLHFQQPGYVLWADAMHKFFPGGWGGAQRQKIKLNVRQNHDAHAATHC